MTFLNQIPGNLAQGLIYGIAAIGVFITFKILDFADLTVDGSFATGGCVLAILLTNGVPIYLCFIIAFLAGCAAGLITAILHCYLGIPGILSGILTQLMLYSINYKILGQASMDVPNRGALISSNVDSGVYTTIPIVLGIVAAVILLLYWFFGTKFGSSIRATGSNEDMSKANGININSRKIVALMLSNGIVAFSGAVLARYLGDAFVSIPGTIVITLAAIIIGTTICGKFVKNFGVTLGFVLLGSVLYYLTYALALSVIYEPIFLKMISAILIIAFLAVPYIRKTYIKNYKAKRSRAKEIK